ncbi:Sterigmatocystin 8-O-methyltransferase [Termitomyces sp. J132]|nr:Sterigmatocystin 8-O-methyltransferase [Termitomyces sp. J132]
MVSQVRQLLNLMTRAVDKLESACNSTASPIPDLYTPFTPESEAFRSNPDAAESARIISAAALHLEAILSPPHVSLYHVVAGHFKSAALRVCLQSHVTEILREAGPKGLHVDDIAGKNGQDARKMAQFLRYLATNHIYREIRPNVFTNTRISSLMDTLKPSEEVIAKPEDKHDNTSGLPALAAHHLDEAFKASAYAWETLSDPATAKSGDPDKSPFSRAFNTTETIWEFFAQDEMRARRFNIGMRGVQALQPADAILKAYEWTALPAGSVVVDVGGGIGSTSLPLAREFPALEIVVQDLHSAIDDGKKFWQKNLPNARVRLEVHNFLTPQPTDREVSVFLMKQILHDWSDEYCVKILTHLRNAAGKDTKLLVVDSLVPFACHDSSDGDDALGISGSIPKEAPTPLLANYGLVNEMVYAMDIDMFLFFNAQERTIRHFKDLLLSAGWKIRQVYRQENDDTYLQSIEAVPVEIPRL